MAHFARIAVIIRHTTDRPTHQWLLIPLVVGSEKSRDREKKKNSGITYRVHIRERTDTTKLSETELQRRVCHSSTVTVVLYTKGEKKKMPRLWRGGYVTRCLRQKIYLRDGLSSARSFTPPSWRCCFAAGKTSIRRRGQPHPPPFASFCYKNYHSNYCTSRGETSHGSTRASPKSGSKPHEKTNTKTMECSWKVAASTE